VGDEQRVHRSSVPAGPRPAVDAPAVSHLAAMMVPVMETTSIRFADAARHLGEAARRQGLVVPAFRSPPRCAEISRSIRRRRDGGATVSVALRGRPWPAVLADLIEGVIATNRLEGAPAATARDGLWAAVVRAAVPAGSEDAPDAEAEGAERTLVAASSGIGSARPVVGAGRPDREGRRLAAA
jgi:hypothetical protein